MYLMYRSVQEQPTGNCGPPDVREIDNKKDSLKNEATMRL